MKNRQESYKDIPIRKSGNQRDFTSEEARSIKAWLKLIGRKSTWSSSVAGLRLIPKRELMILKPMRAGMPLCWDQNNLLSHDNE